MNFIKYHVSKNLFDVSTVEKGRIDNGEVGNVSQTSSLTIEDGTVSFTTTATYRGVCSGFFEIPEGTETIAFNFTRNEALGVKFVFYDSAKIWLNQDYAPTLAGIPPATANIPTGAKYVRLSFTGQIVGGYSYTMSDIMLNTGSQPLPYEPYSSEVWHDSHYIMGTATDTITTLPAVVYANDTTATVGLKGNMEQNGTPTPTTPIQPSECGERTGNLFDGIIGTDNVILNENGSPTSNTAYALSKYIPVEPNKSYVYHFYHNIAENRSTYSICEYDSNKDVIRPLTLQWITENRDYNINFTTQANTAYIRINWKKAPDEDLMLISGSTPQPYEPYGQYKIPISSADTTTPVYLGEVQTTRKVKKLVFTGNENISETTIGSKTIFQISQATVSDKKYGVATETMICSHYKVIDGRTNLETNDNAITTYNATNNNALLIRDDNCLTLTDFTTYLAQQYANGTPVTIWYVLANSTTGVVNEPLRKIGDYADEVSGITIPTIAGANTLSVDTTLQPSEVTVNYKGWHPVTSAHERENGAWD